MISYKLGSVREITINHKMVRNQILADSRFSRNELLDKPTTRSQQRISLNITYHPAFPDTRENPGKYSPSAHI